MPAQVHNIEKIKAYFVESEMDDQNQNDEQKNDKTQNKALSSKMYFSVNFIHSGNNWRF